MQCLNHGYITYSGANSDTASLDRFCAGLVTAMKGDLEKAARVRWWGSCWLVVNICSEGQVLLQHKPQVAEDMPHVYQLTHVPLTDTARLQSELRQALEMCLLIQDVKHDELAQAPPEQQCSTM